MCLKRVGACAAREQGPAFMGLLFLRRRCDILAASLRIWCLTRSRLISEAKQGRACLVSWMGDHLGIPGAGGFFAGLGWAGLGWGEGRGGVRGAEVLSYGGRNELGLFS